MICRSKKCGKELSDDSLYCNYCGMKQVPDKKKELKNPNGYGSVIKLGGRRRKPWAVRMSQIVEDKQKFRYIGYYETKTEALKVLANEQITPTSPKANITFMDLYEEWKLTKAFTSLSQQTKDNYTAAYKHLAKIHKSKFTNIRTAHIQSIIDSLDRSHSTKTKIRIFCGLLYKYAMQNDICNKNYAEFIKLDREEKKEKQIFTDSDIKILFKNDKKPYVDTILILIYTGMRITEFLGLKCSDVDLKSEIPTIVGGIKTEAGRDRVVPIHPKILPYIKRYYDMGFERLVTKEEERGKKGNKKIVSGLPITSNYYRASIFNPILESLNIKGKTPHSARHTFATMLAQAGADTNAIKNILGHEDYAFTADQYTHAKDIAFLKQAIDKI